MSTTYTLNTSTSRAHPMPAPMRRITVPHILKRKVDGSVTTPIVMLTAYTARTAQLLDAHCDILLVGDSLAQVIYGLPSTLGVTLDMMIAHGAAVVRGSMQSMVVVDLPFGTYEESPQQAFKSAAKVLAKTGATAVKMEGGAVLAPTIAFLVERGIPIMGHVGLTPQAINMLGGYGARGKDVSEHQKILHDAKAIADAGAFAIVIEGVVESLAIAITHAVACPAIGIGASALCDGQVLVTEDMLGLFERVPRFVSKFYNLAEQLDDSARRYGEAVKSRSFPGPDNIYRG
jgi:3-methyl-2-oxobutanoate hydroxymethyltransferase